MEIVVLGGNISESLTHCHPELVSGSTFMADEMLKQVQHDNFTYFLRIFVKDSEMFRWEVQDCTSLWGRYSYFSFCIAKVQFCIWHSKAQNCAWEPTMGIGPMI